MTSPAVHKQSMFAPQQGSGHWALFTDAMPFELQKDADGNIIAVPRPGGAALVVQGDLDGILRGGDEAIMFAHAKTDVEKEWARRRDADGKPIPFEVDRDGKKLKIVLVDIPEELYKWGREEGFSSHGWHAMGQVDDPNVVPPIDEQTGPAWSKIQEIYAEHARPFLRDDSKLVSHDWQVAGVAEVLNRDIHRQSALVIHSWSASEASLEHSLSSGRRNKDLANGRTDTDIRHAFLRRWYGASSYHDTVVISSPESAAAYKSAIKWFREHDKEFRGRNPTDAPFKPGTPLVVAIPVPGDDRHTANEVKKHFKHIKKVVAEYPPDIDLSVAVFRGEWYKQGPLMIEAAGHNIRMQTPEGGYTRDAGPRLALVTGVTRPTAHGYQEHYDVEIVEAARAKNIELNSDAKVNPAYANARQALMTTGREITPADEDSLMREYGIDFVQIVPGSFDNVLAYEARADQILGPSRADGYLLTIRETMIVQAVVRALGGYPEGQERYAVPVAGRSVGADAHIRDGVNRAMLISEAELQRVIDDVSAIIGPDGKPLNSFQSVLEARHPGHFSVNPSNTIANMYYPKPKDPSQDPLTPEERNFADSDAVGLAFTMLTAQQETLLRRIEVAEQHAQLYEKHTPIRHMELVRKQMDHAQLVCATLNNILGRTGSVTQIEVDDLLESGLLMSDEQFAEAKRAQDPSYPKFSYFRPSPQNVAHHDTASGVRRHANERARAYGHVRARSALSENMFLYGEFSTEDLNDLVYGGEPRPCEAEEFEFDDRDFDDQGSLV